MKHITLKNVIAVTAFIIASAAAYFSVTGIGKLFAGAMVSAMIMAGAIELGKLVSVSFLYRYWKQIPALLRTPMFIMSILVMFITSLGIYGYLSSAYAKSAEDPLIKNSQIASIVARDSSIANSITLKNNSLVQLSQLRSQQETRLDSAIAKTRTGNSRTVTELQRSLTNADARQIVLQKELDSLYTVKDSLNSQKIKLGVEVQTNSDIGTFIYVAQLLGLELDTVVKWFILIIVLVFDPLSICLVVAYNFLKMREEYIPDLDGPIDTPPKIPTDNSPKSTNSDTGPYYLQPNFNWDSEEWKSDPEAVKYKEHFEI